jgi:hypothetical protein
MKKIIICVVAMTFAFGTIALAKPKKPATPAIYTYQNNTVKKEVALFTKREMTLLINPEERSYLLRLKQFLVKNPDRFFVWKKEILNKKK